MLQEHGREYRAQYYGMISLIDDQVGRLIDHLERSNFRKRTIIVYTADHGELLGDHGLSRKGLFHYEPLIRVPLAISWPGEIPPGQRQSGIVQSVDLPATMLDMAGIDVPAEHQGIALAPWCRGVRNDAPRAFALVTNGGEGPHYDPWPELRTLVTDRWKLQYYVNEGLIELDDLKDDPSELQPGDPGDQSELVLSLIGDRKVGGRGQCRERLGSSQGPVVNRHPATGDRKINGVVNLRAHHSFPSSRTKNSRGDTMLTFRKPSTASRPLSPVTR